MWQSFLHFKAPVMNYYAFNRIELIPAAYFRRSRSLILGLHLLIIKSILTNSGAGIQGYDLYLSASP